MEKLSNYHKKLIINLNKEKILGWLKKKKVRN